MWQSTPLSEIGGKRGKLLFSRARPFQCQVTSCDLCEYTLEKKKFFCRFLYGANARWNREREKRGAGKNSASTEKLGVSYLR